MPRILRLERDDPIPQFFATIRRLREPIERAYFDAFAASDACNDGLRAARELFQSSLHAYDLNQASAGGNGSRDVDQVNELYRIAYADDLRCDLQASLVVLFADNAIQRLGKRLFQRPIGLRGFGTLFNDVHFTTLVRATTNTLRHVDDWADLPFPYPEADAATSPIERVQLENIVVLQKAFGIGKHEAIRDLVSWRTIVTIDGLYGSQPPDYRRFENALLAAAREICETSGPLPLEQFLSEESRN
jgi:hypothetical protein